MSRGEAPFPDRLEAASSTACAILPLTGKTTISGSTATNIFYSLAFQINAGSTLAASNGLGIFPLAFVSGVNQSGQTTAPADAGAKLYIETNKLAAASYSIGINKAAGTATTTFFEGGATPTAYALNTTHFIIVEYSFSGTENGNDTVSLWVDPPSSTFGATTAPTPDISTSVGQDIVSGSGDSINGFEFRQVSSEPGSMTADELSLGVTWADVTPLQPLATPSFSGLTNASNTYGATFTLSGTLSAPGPLYPAMGEGVSVTINGVTEYTTINNSTGGFSMTYSNCNAPFGGGPYTITYHYNGPSMGAASDASTTLTVTNALPVILAGTRLYDGTTNASASILYVANTVPGDVLTVGGGSAGLAGATTGLESITSITGLTLSGAAATNYTMTGATGAVTIATPPFSVGHPDFEPFADATASGGTAYEIGDDLVGQTNAQGLAWFGAGTGAGAQPTVQMGALSIPGLLPDSGNSVTFAGQSGITARLDLGTNSTNSTIYGGSSLTVYYSMSFEALALGDLSSTPSVIAGFNNSTGAQTSQPSTIAARLYTRLDTDGTNYDLGINKIDGVAADIAWEPASYQVGETNFIVAAYTFSGSPSAGTDYVSLWVNPSSSTFGTAIAPTPDVTNMAGGQIGSTSTTDEISSFLLREATTAEPGQMQVDELSIGFTWTDVTPTGAVTPSSILITSQSIDSTGTNVILTWTSLAGAKYQVIASTNIAAPASTWTNVGSAITAAGTSTSSTNPVTTPVTYFRVESP